MTVKYHLPSETQLRPLTPKEQEIGQRILQTNLGLQHLDRVVVITDDQLLDTASIWFESAKPLVAQATLVVLEGMTHSGQEPPMAVLELGQTADVLILHTNYSLTHTSLSKQVKQRGGRVASLPGVSQEILLKTLSIDYQPIRETGRQLQTRLTQSQVISLQSEFGTDLTAQVRAEVVIDDNGFIEAHEIGNLPGGEVFFSPLEGSTTGTWVINGSVADTQLDQPISLEIVGGRVVKISGGQAAQHLENLLNQVGPSALEVAEIGIGTNPVADPHGQLIEAEKAYGTAHLALGNSLGFGGSNASPIHLDGVTLAPTIYLDNQKILEKNQFLF